MEETYKQLVKSINELLIDIHKFKNEPTILINLLEKFQDENIEPLQISSNIQNNKRLSEFGL